MSKNQLFLESAIRIGMRLASQARWKDDVCFWRVMKADASRPSKKVLISMDSPATLYQGTAGIGLFLIELYHLTKDDRIRCVAEGAIRHSILNSELLAPQEMSFYSGRLGIAYATARMGMISGEDGYIAEAIQIIKPIFGNIQKDLDVDLIKGVAGAIPALLYLGSELHHNSFIELAIEIGDHLVEVSKKEPIGWSWKCEPWYVRNLTGFAHGAAGIGYALLELYNVTGLGKYLYAARQAFVYESQFFEAKISNWLDLRSNELSESIYAGLYDKLKVFVDQGGVLAPYRPSFMTAWCHGAAGIGFSRIRAYELLREPLYKQEAYAAIRATLITMDLKNSNYSLCHGLTGNAEMLFYASQVFDEKEFKDKAEICALNGLEIYEKSKEKQWPSGLLNQVKDPSLMLGEAGIGYYFLRLYSLSTPSILLLKPPQNNPRGAKFDVGYQELHTKYINFYWGQILKVIQKEFNIPSSCFTMPLKDFKEQQLILQIYNRVQEFIKRQDAKIRPKLEDAFEIERFKYRLSLEISDYSDEFVETLSQPLMSNFDWYTSTFFLSPYTRIIRTRWDWEKWLGNAGKEKLSNIKRADVHFVLYRKGNTIHKKQLNLLSALILYQVTKPTSLKKISKAVFKEFNVSNSLDVCKLESSIILQLKELYRANIIQAWLKKDVKTNIQQKI